MEQELEKHLENFIKQGYFAIEISKALQDLPLSRIEDFQKILKSENFEGFKNDPLVARIVLLVRNFVSNACCPLHMLTHMVAAMLSIQLDQHETSTLQ